MPGTDILDSTSNAGYWHFLVVVVTASVNTLQLTDKQKNNIYISYK